MALHETPGRSDEWYTPAYVFEAMGVRFDLDPCAAPADQPAPSNAWCDSFSRNSLHYPWEGFVWLNPPFGGRNGILPWLKRFEAHADGVALAPDRTSAPWWQAIGGEMDAILFVSGKIHFIPGPGAKASSPAQGTTLMAKGSRGVQALKNAQHAGLGVLMQRVAS